MRGGFVPVGTRADLPAVRLGASDRTVPTAAWDFYAEITWKERKISTFANKIYFKDTATDKNALFMGTPTDYLSTTLLPS